MNSLNVVFETKLFSLVVLYLAPVTCYYGMSKSVHARDVPGFDVAGY